MAPEREHPALDEDLATRRVELAHSARYHAFLADLSRAGDYDPAFAERASTSVLCILDQYLVAGTPRDPDANIPLAFQELLRGCARPGEQAGEAFDRESLVFSVADDLDIHDELAEEVVRTVCEAARRQLTRGQAEFLGRRFPARIQNLWFGHAHAEPPLEPGQKPRDR
jgi:uncharacterized protein (DUF2267 family)